VGAAHLVQEHVTALQLPEDALVFHHPKQATPSAAQEEDQRDIEGTDHRHDGQVLLGDQRSAQGRLGVKGGGSG